MTEELAKWLISLGVGGILAGGMFLVYRKDVVRFLADVQSLTEAWKEQNDQLITVVKENSSVLARITTVVEALHRRLDFGAEDPASSRRGRPGDPLWDGQERRSGQEPRRGDRRIRLTEP